jgi:1-acyl-sn-glycerol-3-phosphate acyltransferase
MLTEMDLPLVDPREKKGYVFRMTPFRRVVTPVIRALFGGFASLRVFGIDNLPVEGPVVLVANHLTHLDVLAMQFAIRRPIFFMGKAELFQNPLLEVFVRQMGAFPVYRGAHDEWALLHARAVLERGQVLGIFPEGKRSRGRGLYTARPGAARLALETLCPISPMAIDGTQQLFKRFLPRTRVTVTIGAPILPLEGDSPLELTDRIMFALADLLPLGLRGVYARPPFRTRPEKAASAGAGS